MTSFECQTVDSSGLLFCLFPSPEPLLTLPPLLLTAGGVNLTVPGIRLIKECYPTDLERTTLLCIANVFLADQATLGAVAFDQRTVVFDRLQRRVGFSSNVAEYPPNEAADRVAAFRQRLQKAGEKSKQGWRLVLDYFSGLVDKVASHVQAAPAGDRLGSLPAGPV